jgi:hypothetical protein
MQAIAKSERAIYQWTGFHAALRLSYRSLGDMERSVSTRHDRFHLDSLFALQKCAVGQMAGVSIKDLASEAKWLRRSWAGVRLGACLG